MTKYDWIYYELHPDGRLRDVNTGEDGNPNWPSFKTDEQAEQYLKDNDIRGNVC